MLLRIVTTVWDQTVRERLTKLILQLDRPGKGLFWLHLLDGQQGGILPFVPLRMIARIRVSMRGDNTPTRNDGDSFFLGKLVQF